MTTPNPTAPLWPTDFQGCRVQGQYLDLSGIPLSGTVTFSASPPAVLDYENSLIIVPKVFTATLDGNGAIDIVLPATDDPDINPTKWTYAVSENFTGGRKYNIEAPQNSTINLVDASPVPAGNGAPMVRGPRGEAGGIQNVNGKTGDIIVLVPSDIGADAAGAAAAVLATSLQKAANLTDLASVSAARTNLGLGTAAVANSTAFDAAGAAAAVTTALNAFMSGLTGLQTDVVTDWNNANVPGLYVGDSASNGPALHVYVGFCFQRTDVGGGGQTQLVVRTTTGDAPEIWMRNGNGTGVWQAWHQVAGTPTWVTLPTLAGYTTTTTAQYCNLGNVVYLRGRIDKNSGSMPTSLTQISATGALPASCRPAISATILVSAEDPAFVTTARLTVDTNGTLWETMATGQPGILLDGVSFVAG